MRIEPRVDAMTPDVAFQVGDDLVAGRPPGPGRKREAREVGHPPGTVQQEPVVTTPPARADLLGTIQDHRVDAMLSERCRRGETRGAGADHDDVVDGDRAGRRRRHTPAYASACGSGRPGCSSTEPRFGTITLRRKYRTSVPSWL